MPGLPVAVVAASYGWRTALVVGATIVVASATTAALARRGTER